MFSTLTLFLKSTSATLNGYRRQPRRYNSQAASFSLWDSHERCFHVCERVSACLSYSSRNQKHSSLKHFQIFSISMYRYCKLCCCYCCCVRACITPPKALDVVAAMVQQTCMYCSIYFEVPGTGVAVRVIFGDSDLAVHGSNPHFL